VKPFWSALLVFLVAAGCSASPALSPTAPPMAANVEAPTVIPRTPTSITITDSLGRQVLLPDVPQRIVITGKALIMIVDAAYMFPEAPGRMAALGNAGQGTSNFISLIDPDYAGKATLQQDASAEQIASARPDLVLLKSYLAETVGKSLEPLTIPVVYVDFETPDQYQRDLAILGQVFQNPVRAEEVASYYREAVDHVLSALENVTTRPRTLLLYHTDRDGAVAFNVPPLAWMQTQLVQLAGGEPVWSGANPGSGWTKVTMEQIAAWDADMVLIVSYTENPSDVVAELKADPQWRELRAVQEGNLLAFPGDLYSWDQPDARWILGLFWLAQRLHPEQLAGADIVQEAQQFYQTLYGLDADFFEAKIRPTFKGDMR